MWFLFLLLAVPETGARLCSTPVYDICKPPRYHPDVIPGSEEELNKICPVFSENLECLHSYDRACAGRTRIVGLEPPVYYETVREFLDQACNEDTELHKVLARNLPCIKHRISLGNLTCRDNRRKVLDAYGGFLDTNASARRKAMGEENRKDRMDCLYDVFTTACVLENINSECGFLAYEAGVYAARKTAFLEDWCGPEAFADIAQAIPRLKLDDQLKDLLRQYFVKTA